MAPRNQKEHCCSILGGFQCTDIPDSSTNRSHGQVGDFSKPSNGFKGKASLAGHSGTRAKHALRGPVFCVFCVFPLVFLALVSLSGCQVKFLPLPFRLLHSAHSLRQTLRPAETTRSSFEPKRLEATQSHFDAEVQKNLRCIELWPREPLASIRLDASMAFCGKSTTFLGKPSCKAW